MHRLKHKWAERIEIVDLILRDALIVKIWADTTVKKAIWADTNVFVHIVFVLYSPFF